MRLPRRRACAVSDCRGPHFSHTHTPLRLSLCARSVECVWERAFVLVCVCVCFDGSAREAGRSGGSASERREAQRNFHAFASPRCLFFLLYDGEDAQKTQRRFPKSRARPNWALIRLLMNRARPERAITTGLLRDSRDVRFLWVPAAAAASG